MLRNLSCCGISMCKKLFIFCDWGVHEEIDFYVTLFYIYLESKSIDRNKLNYGSRGDNYRFSSFTGSQEISFYSSKVTMEPLTEKMLVRLCHKVIIQ